MSTQSMEYRPHGGECCGYYHILWMGSGPDQPNAMEGHRVFDRTTKAEALALLLERHDNNYGPASRVGGERFVEVILNDRQLRDTGYGLWRDTLLSFGFVEVMDARNANTGNRIHVFIRYISNDATRVNFLRGPVHLYPVPARIPPVAPPPPPPPPPVVTEILTEYYAVRRNGMKYGTYISELAAREVHPNLRVFHRRTIFSNGADSWETL